MKVKNLLAILLALTFLVIPVSAEENDDLIQPHDMSIASGYLYDATQFTETYKLTYENGRFVNFYVENLGDVSVEITINGAGAKTLAPGQSGQISCAVIFLIPEYKFKAVPTPNGGNISIYYSIAQRDSI